MSFLTQLPEALYPQTKFANFRPGAAFDLDTARALIWLSQLAYETDTAKIKRICGGLEITLIGDPIHKSVASALPIASTYVMVFDVSGSTVVSFAGTDPVVLANWVSDFDIRSTDGGAAEGFLAALQVVEFDVLARLPAGHPVVVTGHSLGGALAVLLAQRLDAVRPDVQAVYTFGMPRPGREPFVAPYNASELGKRTFRLVHGNDIVPTVAPSKFDFQHVGRYAKAPENGKFTVAEDVAGSNEPGFEEGVANELHDLLRDPMGQIGAYARRLRDAAAALLGRPVPHTRSDTAGIVIDMLPPRLRDHMPDRYIAACTH